MAIPVKRWPSQRTMGSPMGLCPYEALGVSRDDTYEQIAAAFYRQSFFRLISNPATRFRKADRMASLEDLLHACNAILSSERCLCGCIECTRARYLDFDLSALCSPFRFSGYSDSELGFFKVYGDVFSAIHSREVSRAELIGLGHLVPPAPPIGYAGSTFADVSAFYRYWLGFSTVMDHGWVVEGDDTSSMKERKVGKEEWNSIVHLLVLFVRGVDNRHCGHDRWKDLQGKAKGKIDDEIEEVEDEVEMKKDDEELKLGMFEGMALIYEKILLAIMKGEVGDEAKMLLDSVWRMKLGGSSEIDELVEDDEDEERKGQRREKMMLESLRVVFVESLYAAQAGEIMNESQVLLEKLWMKQGMQLESSNMDEIEEEEEDKDEEKKLEKLWMKHRMQLESSNINEIEEEREEEEKDEEEKRLEKLWMRQGMQLESSNTDKIVEEQEEEDDDDKEEEEKKKKRHEKLLMIYKNAMFRIVSVIDEKEKNAKVEKVNCKQARMLCEEALNILIAKLGELGDEIVEDDDKANNQEKEEAKMKLNSVWRLLEKVSAKVDDLLNPGELQEDDEELWNHASVMEIFADAFNKIVSAFTAQTWPQKDDRDDNAQEEGKMQIELDLQFDDEFVLVEKNKEVEQHGNGNNIGPFSFY